MTYRVLFCGGREWTASGPIVDKLMMVGIKHPGLVLVHGAGRGADLIAAAAAEQLGMSVEAHPADWDAHGRAAGPLRNHEMLASGLHAVYAFKVGFDKEMRSGGTEHMVRIALEAGVPCQVISSVPPSQQPRIVHQTIASSSEGTTTKCGLTRQHHSTCSGFQSAVSCPECLRRMETTS